ncbi:M48 family metallopeptidase [Shewanella gelidii]|nr:M48 family metallopeptidase [Shewanella gelidii]MCL1097129.1 M48 family metallopeptidase [Shewanella gelidii]
MKKILIVASALMLTACVSTKSPTGRGQMLLYSADQMQQMGGQSFAEMKKQQTVSQNSKTNAYVSCVANRITNALPEKKSWEVVVFESNQVNAFALPGGHIGVYTGLLQVAENEDQLAAVIGHEVAHVLARHGNEKVSRAQISGLGIQLADAALGASGVSNKDLYMQALGLGVNLGYVLPYGRDQETEADEVGIELMAKAGFDPSMSIELWRNMSKAGGDQGPEILSTHPSHSSRISNLDKLQAKVMPLYLQARKAGMKSCQLEKK